MFTWLSDLFRPTPQWPEHENAGDTPPREGQSIEEQKIALDKDKFRYERFRDTQTRRTDFRNNVVIAIAVAAVGGYVGYWIEHHHKELLVELAKQNEVELIDLRLLRVKQINLCADLVTYSSALAATTGDENSWPVSRLSFNQLFYAIALIGNASLKTAVEEYEKLRWLHENTFVGINDGNKECYNENPKTGYCRKRDKSIAGTNPNQTAEATKVAEAAFMKNKLVPAAEKLSELCIQIFSTKPNKASPRP